MSLLRFLGSKKKKKKKNAWETIKEGISAWCERGLTSFQVKQKITAINNTHTNKDLHKKKKKLGKATKGKKILVAG